MPRSPKPRPNPLLWVWYCFGGRLPQRYREWVLHNVTCSTWMLRHLGHSSVQLSPGLLFLLLPGPQWISALAVVGGYILGLWYSLSYMEHTSEHRLYKHGYPLGTGRRTREQAHAEQRSARAANYARIYRNQPESE